MTTFTPKKKGSPQSMRSPTSLAVRGNGQESAQQPAPTHDEIARCAYDIYIAHGRVDGRSELDWRQAEEELTQTHRASSPKP